MNSSDFVGMAKEDIEEECQEYVTMKLSPWSQ